jgi:hypothetical protein
MRRQEARQRAKGRGQRPHHGNKAPELNNLITQKPKNLNFDLKTFNFKH